MAQYLRPDANISGVTNDYLGWYTGYTAIDETSYSDADYMYCAEGTNATAEIRLSDVSDPTSSSGHIIRFRMWQQNNPNQRTLSVALVQGSTVIRTYDAGNCPTSATPYSFTLTSGEADSITDYTDLRLRFIGDGNVSSPAKNKSVIYVSWAEMEVPTAGPSDLSINKSDSVDATDSPSVGEPYPLPTLSINKSDAVDVTDSPSVGEPYPPGDLSISTTTATYYFDASDSGPTDSNSVWTNESLAFNGSIDNYAYPSANSEDGGATNNMYAEGTNAPTSGGTITQVRARIYARSQGLTQNAKIYSDGGSELLGTASYSGIAAGYSSYITLSEPDGGWDWTKVSSLEVNIYESELSAVPSSRIYLVEIEVTYTNSDLVTVSENVDVEISALTDLSKSVSDSTTLSEDPTVSVEALATPEINKSDSVGVLEDATAYVEPLATPEINKSESVSIVDSPDVGVQAVPVLEIDVNDTPSVVDVPSVEPQEIPTLSIDVSDEITVEDSKTVSVEAMEVLEVDASSDVSVADSPSVEAMEVSTDLDISKSETVTVSENIDIDFPPTVQLDGPTDEGSTFNPTPTLLFTGTDVNGDALEYEVQVDNTGAFAGEPSLLTQNTTQEDTEFIYTGVSQSFTGDGNTIDSASFVIQKRSDFSGQPYGYASVRIYAHDGTYGTSSIPTGSLLAESETIYIGTFSTSLTWAEFEFTGANRITLANGTYYVAVLYYDGLDGSHMAFRHSKTNPNYHAGNFARDSSGTWTPNSAYDLTFNVYTAPAMSGYSSETDAGFVNQDDGGDTHPFTSGDQIGYTFQTPLTVNTYYWRVRAEDTNGWGDWSATYSFDFVEASIDKSEAVSIGESVDISIISGAIEINVSDSTSVADSPEVFIPELNTSVSDSAGVADSPSTFIPEFNVDVSDSSTVVDSPSVNVGVIGSYDISVSDATSIEDSPSVSVVAIEELSVNVSDSTSLEDSPTVSIVALEIYEIDETESTTVEDSPSVSVVALSTPEIDVSDEVSVADSPETSVVALTTPEINVNEEVSLADVPSVSVSSPGEFDISVSEMTTLDESVSVKIPELFVNISDAITVTENVAHFVTPLFIDVDSSVSVGDTVIIRTDDLAVSTSDSTSLEEAKSIEFEEITPAEIDANDQITLAEQVGVQLSTPTISVLDSATVSEDLSVATTEPEALSINVSDEISTDEQVYAITEFLNILVNDSVGVADEPDTFRDIALLVSVEDSVSVEDIPQYRDNLVIVTERVSLDVANNITDSDSVTVEEDVSLLIEYLVVSVSEDVSVEDSPTLYNSGPFNLEVSEDVSVDEDVNLATSDLEIGVYEELLVFEELVVVNEFLLISTSDSTSLAEAVLATHAYNIGVDDSITTGEFQKLIRNQKSKKIVGDIKKDRVSFKLGAHKPKINVGRMK